MFLFVREHRLDDLRIRRGSNERSAKVSHSLGGALAQNVAAKRLGTKNLTGSGNLESFLRRAVGLLLGHK